MTCTSQSDHVPDNAVLYGQFSVGERHVCTVWQGEFVCEESKALCTILNELQIMYLSIVIL